MKPNKYIIALSLIAVVLSAIWFKDKILLAAGEEGLPLYHATRMFNFYKNVWVDASTGIPVPFGLSTLTFFGAASFLQNIGLSPWLIQAILFFIILLTPLISMYKLSELLLPDSKNSTKFVVSLFYLFNLFTMSQIWQRFTYPLILLWSFLPLFLFFWIKWLQNHRLKDLLFFVIFSFIFSYTYSLLVNIPTVWFLALVYWIFMIFKEKSRRFRIIILGILGIIVWLICNIWWIYPLGQIKYTSLIESASFFNNFESLRGVSKSFPTSLILTLKHGMFFGDQSVFYWFYSNWLIKLISWIIFFICLLGLWISRRQYIWPYLFIIFILGWFISKGTNFPLGIAFYHFLFSTIAPSVLYRNSYEKFGVIWLFSYSFFFSFGLNWILDKFKQSKRLVFLSIIFISCGVLVWPIWTGQLFEKRVHVVVPTYYEETNQYLKSQNYSRLLQLPHVDGDGIWYEWGFIGIDPILMLYDVGSIATVTRNNLDNIYKIMPNYFKERNFPKVLATLNISHIILRKDIHPKSQSVGSLKETENYIKAWRDVTFEKTFTKLDVYSLGENLLPGRIYIANQLFQVNNYNELMETFVSEEFNPKTQALAVKLKNFAISEFKKTDTIPEIEYKMISRSHYKVFVKDAREDFILILANSYNVSWSAQAGKEIFPKHFIINGYANGWVINKRGNYEIDLIYKVWPWD